MFWIDWTRIDPHYFYMQGLITGVIMTLVVGHTLSRLVAAIRNQP